MILKKALAQAAVAFAMLGPAAAQKQIVPLTPEEQKTQILFDAFSKCASAKPRPYVEEAFVLANRGPVEVSERLNVVGLANHIEQQIVENTKVKIYTQMKLGDFKGAISTLASALAVGHNFEDECLKELDISEEQIADINAFIEKYVAPSSKLNDNEQPDRGFDKSSWHYT